MKKQRSGKKSSEKEPRIGTYVAVPTITPDGKPKGVFRMGVGFVELMRGMAKTEMQQLREQCRDVLEGPRGEALRRLIEISWSDGRLAGLLSPTAMATTAEVERIRLNLERGRQKGGEATKQKTEPRRATIRKRFQEIRKSGIRTMAARELIQRECAAANEQISLRTIERYTAGLS